MNITNEQVSHSQFGMGTVIDQTVTMVTVQFPEDVGVKKFLYPTAFESFLSLCDPVMKETMDSELKQLRERREEEKRKHAQEDEKHREEKRSEQKRTITKKRTYSKKTLVKSKKQTEAEDVPSIEKDIEDGGDFSAN